MKRRNGEQLMRSHERDVRRFVEGHRRRTLEKIESMDDSFFEALDEAGATYAKPATVTETR